MGLCLKNLNMCHVILAHSVVAFGEKNRKTLCHRDLFLSFIISPPGTTKETRLSPWRRPGPFCDLCQVLTGHSHSDKEEKGPRTHSHSAIAPASTHLWACLCVPGAGCLGCQGHRDSGGRRGSSEAVAPGHEAHKQDEV